MSTQGVALV